MIFCSSLLELLIAAGLPFLSKATNEHVASKPMPLILAGLMPAAIS